MAFTLTGDKLSFENLDYIFWNRPVLEFSPEDLQKFREKGEVISTEAATLAANFLAVHAVGFGAVIPEEKVRLALVVCLHILLKYKKEIIQPTTLNRLLAFYNRDIFPAVYGQSTLISQAAQLALPLVGEGKVKYQGYDLNATDILDIFSWQPLNLNLPEAGTLIKQDILINTDSVYSLLQLKPLVSWLKYLNEVFAGIINTSPEALSSKTADFLSTFASAQEASEGSLNETQESNNLAVLNQAFANLAVSLKQMLALVADCIAKTFAHLEATSEPPATTSFAQAATLSIFFKSQSEQFAGLHTSEISEEITFQLLNEGFNGLIAITEKLVALAFWSISQVGKVFNLAAENLTLAAYYHSDLFVPKELVLHQLDNIVSYIRTHSPTP